MAKRQSSKFTFIPYVGLEEKSRRQRELLDSVARRHVAIAYHENKRAKQQHQEAQEDALKARDDFYTSTTSSVPGLTYPKTSTALLTATPPAWLPAHGTASQHGEHEEAVDWQQASQRPPEDALEVQRVHALNYSSRPLTDFDHAAIQFFLQHGQAQIPVLKLGQYLIGSSAKKLVIAESLARRAVQQPPLLDSIVAYTAFNMRTQRLNATILVSHGQRATYSAVRSLRVAMTTSECLQDLTLSYAVLHLCMVALAQGQVRAGGVHLKFLAEVIRNLQPQSEHEYDLLALIRGIDLRYALQSGHPPITKRFRWSSLYQLSDSKPRDSVPSMPQVIRTEHRRVLDSSGSCESRYTSDQVSWNRGPVQGATTFPYNFDTAMAWGIISLSLQPVLSSYTDALALLSQLSKKGEVPQLTKFQARAKVYECLDMLCTEWYDMNSPISDDLDECISHADERVAADIDFSLDKAVIIAIELHLIMVLGSGYTLIVLGRRLRRVLEDQKKPSGSSVYQASGFEEKVLRGSLNLWVLLMGMLATTGRSADDYYWMQNYAQETVLSLGLTAEGQVLALMESLWPAGSCIREDFVDVVHFLFNDTRPG